MVKKLICVVCPLGCELNVEVDGGSLIRIDGNKCKRGAEYTIAECTNPLRTLTSVVRIVNAVQPVAPVKSDRPIPKDLLFECMKEINKCQLLAPIRVGDIVIENIMNTGANIISTSNVMPACFDMGRCQAPQNH